MTDTPLIRAARALALSDSGEDCYDSLDEASQERLQESVRAVLGASYAGLADALGKSRRQLQADHNRALATKGLYPDNHWQPSDEALVRTALSE